MSNNKKNVNNSNNKSKQVDDLQEFVESDGYSIVEMFNTLIDTKSGVQFVRDFASGKYRCRVRVKENETKEFDLEKTMNFMQKLIQGYLMDELSTYRLAYLKLFDPQAKIPEDSANQKKIDDAIKIIDSIVDGDKIKQGIADNDIEAIEKKKRDISIQLVTISFMKAFLSIHQYSKVFESAPVGNVEGFKSKNLDLCVKMISECNWVEPNAKIFALSALFTTVSSILDMASNHFKVHSLSDGDVIIYLEGYIDREEFERFVSIGR